MFSIFRGYGTEKIHSDNGSSNGKERAKYHRLQEMMFEVCFEVKPKMGANCCAEGTWREIMTNTPTELKLIAKIAPNEKEMARQRPGQTSGQGVGNETDGFSIKQKWN